MIIWLFSDTHCRHKYLKPPKADLAIFCGDEANHFDPIQNEIEARPFFEWYSKVDIQHKLYIPGNHSTAVEAGLIETDDYGILNINNAIIDLYGYRIYGNATTPRYGKSGAYMMKRNRTSLVWDNIPDCDILVTHGPPQGILDLTTNLEGDLVQVGDKSLYNRVVEMQPKMHCFGHIHKEKNFHNRGIFSYNDTNFINCACWSHRTNEFDQGIIYDIN